MSGPHKVAPWVCYVIVTIVAIVLVVLFPAAALGWLLGVGLWVVLAPGYFLASVVVACLVAALVTLPARKLMEASDWHGLVLKVSVGVWIVLSLVAVALGE